MLAATIPLDVIHVSNPCPASWEKMQGDQRVRFCQECSLHVYNISELTKDAAEKLIRAHEGRLCVRYFTRADGTILTQDCGGGLRRAARRARAMVAAGAMLAVSAVLAPLGWGSASKWRTSAPTTPPRMIEARPLPVMGDIAAPLAVQPVPQATMGVIAMDRTPPAPAPKAAPADHRVSKTKPAPKPRTQVTARGR
jgi:hypothetical protein